MFTIVIFILIYHRHKPIDNIRGINCIPSLPVEVFLLLARKCILGRSLRGLPLAYNVSK
jgi:hypothetical protein